MKVSDPLLRTWDETLRLKGHAPAILDEAGTVLRTFTQLEERAEQLAAGLGAFERGAVVGVQIGNHPDWPSILLACFRLGIVVLPLDRSISVQERAAALKICRASGLLQSSEGTNSTQPELPPVSVLNQQTVSWGDHPRVF